MFEPDTGIIRGHGKRKFRPNIPFGNHIWMIQDMNFAYDLEDTLKISVEFFSYCIPNVKRRELGKTLEWFASAPQKDIKKYRKFFLFL